MKIDRKKKQLAKINLIPILDAIFIFIFFLLMSAQFLEIYEIGTDAPAITTIDDEKDKRPPLNLVLEISKSAITVKTGLDGDVYTTLNNVRSKVYNVGKLNKVLEEIKVKNIEEKSIIFRPQSNVTYADLIGIMDSVREIEKEATTLVGKGKKGNLIETRTLFDMVIFETII